MKIVTAIAKSARTRCVPGAAAVLTWIGICGLPAGPARVWLDGSEVTGEPHLNAAGQYIVVDAFEVR